MPPTAVPIPEPAELTRIIAEDHGGDWRAWFTRRPEVVFGGSTAKGAVDQLMRAAGLDPSSVALLYHGIGPRRHEYRIKSALCPDCRGTGRYTGFHDVEDCRGCGGYGRV